MSSDDHVLGLLAKANPVPDPITYAARARHEANEQRRDPMAATTLHTIEPVATPAKRGWSTGFAAAAVVLLVAIAAFLLWTRAENDVASSRALATVEAVYEALNDHDQAAWEQLNTPLALAAAGDIVAITQSMGSRYEIIDPCRVVEEQADGDVVVECGVHWTDDFRGPAGISSIFTNTHTVNAEGLIWKTEDDIDLFDLEESFAYSRAFWAWLEEAHPEVHAEIAPTNWQAFPGYQGDPTDALVAIEYVEEFVAQSDVYPIGD